LQKRSAVDPANTRLEPLNLFNLHFDIDGPAKTSCHSLSSGFQAEIQTSPNLGSLRRASGLCRNRNKKPFSIAPVLGAVRTSHKYLNYINFGILVECWFGIFRHASQPDY